MTIKVTMGNSSSKAQKKLPGYTGEYRTIRDCSPWRQRGRSELGEPEAEVSGGQQSSLAV